MRRYLLSCCLILLPCIGLGTWAGYQYVLAYQRDEAVLRLSFRELCTDAAREKTASMLSALERQMMSIVIREDPYSLLSGLEQIEKSPLIDTIVLLEGGSPMGTNRGSVVTPVEQETPPPQELLKARQLEYVVQDFDQAFEEYQRLVDHKRISIRREAYLGMVGCLLKKEQYKESAEKLLAAFAVQPIEKNSLKQMMALGLLIYEGLEQAEEKTKAAHVLYVIWHHSRHLHPSDAAKVEKAIRDSQAHLSPDQQKQVQHHFLCQRYREGRAAFLAGATIQERQWLLPVSTEGTPHGLDYKHFPPEGRIWMKLEMPSRAVRIGAELKIEALSRSTSISLSTVAGLRELASTYHARFDRPISQPHAFISIDGPWGETLQIAYPTWPGEQKQRYLNPIWVIASFLMCGMVLIVLGGFTLVRAVRRDQALVQLKTDFVSNVSHELKTPLALIRMYGEMLQLGYANNEADRKQCYDVIAKEAERLTLLINNVLDFAKIERGDKTYSQEPVDLKKLTRDVISTYQQQIETGGFVLHVDLSTVPPVMGDAIALSQALLNLLSNAIKYSDTNKEIAVSLTTEDRWITLAVQDKGIGIAKTEHKRIFDQFYRVETGLTRQTRGSGLGLSLVHHIVLAHDGRLDVESTPDEGSTFSIRLPALEEERT